MRDKSVLLVDDEIIFNYIHKRLISMLNFSCETDEAISASDALKLMEERSLEGKAPYDLVFIDLKMSVIDGLDFIRIYQNSRMFSPRTRVVVVAVCVDPKEEEAIRSLGVMDVLYKPLSFDQLQMICTPDQIHYSY